MYTCIYVCADCIYLFIFYALYLFSRLFSCLQVAARLVQMANAKVVLSQRLSPKHVDLGSFVVILCFGVHCQSFKFKTN